MEGGLERHEAIPGSLIQWAQPEREAGQKDGYIMPTVDKEEMLNLARRLESDWWWTHRMASGASVTPR